MVTLCKWSYMDWSHSTSTCSLSCQFFINQRK